MLTLSQCGAWYYATSSRVSAAAVGRRTPLNAEPLNGRRGALNHTELVLTIAEVAVAFAGFSGLVGILGRSGSRDSDVAQAFRLRGVILTSLLVVAFSLVPFVAHGLGLRVVAAWRISSVLFFLAGGGISVYALVEIRRALRAQSPMPPALRPRLAGSFGPAILAEASLAAIAIGLVGPRESGFYVAALCLYLFAGGFIFVEMLFSYLTIEWD